MVRLEKKLMSSNDEAGLDLPARTLGGGARWPGLKVVEESAGAHGWGATSPTTTTTARGQVAAKSGRHHSGTRMRRGPAT